MKIELTPDQAAILRPLLELSAVDSLDPRIVIGQLARGDWRDPGKTWLIYTTIKPGTARKIRKLIENERADAKDPSLG